MSLQQDYLVQMFVRFAEAIRLSWERAAGKQADPQGSADLLEQAVGQAVDIDGNVLLGLAPESVAGILKVTDTDPMVVEYIVRTLLLESQYLTEAGNGSLAQLRREQAFSIASSYGVELDDDAVTPEELEALFEETIPAEHSGAYVDSDGETR